MPQLLRPLQDLTVQVHQQVAQDHQLPALQQVAHHPEVPVTQEAHVTQLAAHLHQTV